MATNGSFLLKSQLLTAVSRDGGLTMAAIERLTAGALRQRGFMLVLVAVLAVTGIYAYRELPVEAFPDLTNNQVVVVTEAAGLAAPEVETRITYPIETALMGLPGAAEVQVASPSTGCRSSLSCSTTASRCTWPASW